MGEIDEAALVVLGAVLALLGAWLADRRKVEHQRATRWIERRREVYSSFIHSAREIFHSLERFLPDGPIGDNVASVEQRWRELEETYSDFLLIASESTFQVAAEVRAWCENAAKLLVASEPDEAAIKRHMQFFWAPAAAFLDRCRADVESPRVISIWHRNAQDKSVSGSEPNPYVAP
ncbi:MAG TPA: hypothetical protein VEV43_08280 [Actinomycetota bacterium]|nr:hypothetical protein [Actinomycetota bacterium]